MKQPKVLFQIILIAVILSTHIYAALTPANSVVNWIKTDDAFYYFKTAVHILNGDGPTFDGLGLTNGFHPLWMLICLPVFLLARIDLILPLRVIIVLLGLLDIATALILFRMVERYFSLKVSILITLFWAIGSYIHATTTMMSMETGINAFFLIFLFDQVLLFKRKRQINPPGVRSILIVSIAAVLALLSRLDNIFLIAILGLIILVDWDDTRALLLGDGMIILISTYASFLLRLGFDRYYYYMPFAIWMAVIGLALKPAAFFILRLYRVDDLAPLKKSLLRTIAGATAASALQAACIFALIQFGLITRFPRSAIPVDWILSTVLFVVLRVGIAWRYHAGRYHAGRYQSNPPSPKSPPLTRPVWMGWLRRALLYFGPIALVLFVYMAANTAIVGTAMPVSGQIKRWWGTIYTVYGRPADSLTKLFWLEGPKKSGPWSLANKLPFSLAEDTSLLFTGQIETTGPASKVYNTAVDANLILLVGAGLILLIWGRRRFFHLGGEMSIAPLLAGCLIHAMSYTLTGYVGTSSWYWISEMFLLTLIAGIALEAVSGVLSRFRWLKPLGTAVFIAAAAFLVAVHINTIVRLLPNKLEAGHEEDYLGGVKALEQTTEPGSLIGSTGGGTIGYFIADRTIVNLDGLINSNEYFQMMQAGQADEYLNRIGLDYVYGAKYILVHSEPYKYMFEDRLEDLGEVAGSELYRYHDPKIELPAP